MTSNDDLLFPEEAEETTHDRQELSPSAYNQLINSVGPDLSIPSIFGHQDVENKQQEDQEHIKLFDQSQFVDNLGPVYALPTFPWGHTSNQTHENIHFNHKQNADVHPAQHMDDHQWQHGNNQNIKSLQGQQATHVDPALFGQNQFIHNLGPVYAVPTYPSQSGQYYGQKQSDEHMKNHHQQCNCFHKPVAFIPHYMPYPFTPHYYW